MFTRSAITPPEVNGFGCNLGISEYIVWSWPRQILGAILAEARAGDLAEFFCQVNNARLCRSSVSQFSRNLHTKRVSVTRRILLETFFEHLPLRGLFFQKNVIIVNDFWLQAGISRKWLQILENHGSLARLWNVGFPSVPLESTQSFPGQQAPYEEGLSSMHRCTAMQPAHAALTWHYIIIKSFAGWQHHLDIALLLSNE